MFARILCNRSTYKLHRLATLAKGASSAVRNLRLDFDWLFMAFYAPSVLKFNNYDRTLKLNLLLCKLQGYALISELLVGKKRFFQIASEPDDGNWSSGNGLWDQRVVIICLSKKFTFNIFGIRKLKKKT